VLGLSSGACAAAESCSAPCDQVGMVSTMLQSEALEDATEAYTGSRWVMQQEHLLFIYPLDVSQCCHIKAVCTYSVHGITCRHILNLNAPLSSSLPLFLLDLLALRTIVLSSRWLSRRWQSVSRLSAGRRSEPLCSCVTSNLQKAEPAALFSLINCSKPEHACITNVTSTDHERSISSPAAAPSCTASRMRCSAATHTHAMSNARRTDQPLSSWLPELRCHAWSQFKRHPFWGGASSLRTNVPNAKCTKLDCNLSARYPRCRGPPAMHDLGRGIG
jgi:hypothetical protein